VSTTGIYGSVAHAFFFFRGGGGERQAVRRSHSPDTGTITSSHPLASTYRPSEAVEMGGGTAFSMHAVCPMHCLASHHTAIRSSFSLIIEHRCQA